MGDQRNRVHVDNERYVCASQLCSDTGIGIHYRDTLRN